MRREAAQRDSQIQGYVSLVERECEEMIEQRRQAENDHAEVLELCNTLTDRLEKTTASAE